jgi:acyl carrier protein
MEPGLRTGEEGTEARVARVLRESVGVDPERITPDARLVEDLGVDSLDRIELVFELESEFGIEIPDQEIAQVQTVGDVVRRLEEAMARGEG